MSRGVVGCSKVKRWESWSRSESESDKGVKLQLADPKLSELPMARVKST